MKNIFLAMVSFMLACNVSAAPFVNGKQFITLNKPVTATPQVLEFFSFFCPHCYEFEKAWCSHQTVRKDFFLHSKIVKYHIINFGGEMGKILTHAWAMAIIMGVEEKVIFPIFEGLLSKHTITDSLSLKKAFVNATGIKSEEYDTGWNTPIVLALLEKQKKISKEVNLPGVPTMLINGKYIVNSDRLDTSSIHAYIHQYANIVRYLLGQK
ncbi:DsbA family protein [Candidatus Erwinia haradaeae]|uniref:Thiol:disulfide interchange protein n=1 Tax=Candidatus Erwinia haradaeae TaxID=1922217 RepID=A0A451D9T8_9GAMM|nr:DsbA family protein [Candidatus Erwinia haradaeae]VFP82999.1 Thiol:disulfide interchange protein DsbA [Candidatus Erwinia haradaeae]